MVPSDTSSTYTDVPAACDRVVPSRLLKTAVLRFRMVAVARFLPLRVPGGSRP